MTDASVTPDAPQQPETPNANGGGTGQAVTFTQEQLDAIVRDRLERATKKTQADILAKLGTDDVEAARKAIEDAAKAKEAQMSELEKSQAEIARLKAQAEKAQAQAEQAQLRAEEMRLQSLVISKAGAFVDPMDAWQFLDKSKLTADDQGNYTGIDEAIKALAESKPYLVKADGGPSGGTPARSKPKTMAEKLLEIKNKETNPDQPVRINF